MCYRALGVLKPAPHSCQINQNQKSWVLAEIFAWLIKRFSLAVAVTSGAIWQQEQECKTVDAKYMGSSQVAVYAPANFDFSAVLPCRPVRCGTRTCLRKVCASLLLVHNPASLTCFQSGTLSLQVQSAGIFWLLLDIPEVGARSVIVCAHKHAVSLVTESVARCKPCFAVCWLAQSENAQGGGF